MSGQDTFPMTPLDQMVSSESLQILKGPRCHTRLHLPENCFPYSRNFRSLKPRSPFSRIPASLSAMSVETPEVSSFEMLEEIRRFALGRSKENIESLISALSTMQIFQAMQQEESESIKKDPEECSGREEG